MATTPRRWRYATSNSNIFERSRLGCCRRTWVGIGSATACTGRRRRFVGKILPGAPDNIRQSADEARKAQLCLEEVKVNAAGLSENKLNKKLTKAMAAAVAADAAALSAETRVPFLAECPSLGDKLVEIVASARQSALNAAHRAACARNWDQSAYLYTYVVDATMEA